jgi:hypothetical protein
MKHLLALLAATAVLVLAAPAGARPIDLDTPSPSSAPAPAPAPAPAVADTPGGGSETWVVILAAGLAFVAGAAGARLVLVRRISPAV